MYNFVVIDDLQETRTEGDSTDYTEHRLTKTAWNEYSQFPFSLEIKSFKQHQAGVAVPQGVERVDW